MMKRKLIVIAIVLAVAAFLFWGYNLVFAPETIQGEKMVHVEVIAQEHGIDEHFEFYTDAEYLEQLLLEHSDQLQLVLKESDLGSIVIGLAGVETDFINQYWSIYVNDTYAVFGVSQQVVADGDVFRFELAAVR